jgi:dihydrofolate reductase
MRDRIMGKVIAIMSMSLDGYVADPGDGVDEVFDWYTAGDVVVPIGTSGMTFRVSAPSAAHLHGLMGEVGAMFTGRRTFDKAEGWDGQHPWGIPAFVLTHDVPAGWPRPGSTVHFVTDGLESAVAQAAAAAGERAVGCTAATPSGSASTPDCWTSSTSISSRCCSDPGSRCSASSAQRP